LKTYWEGCISRQDVIDEFSIASTQATKDFAAVKNLYPGAVIYDPSERRYKPGSSLGRLVSSYSFDQYHTNLRGKLDYAYTIEPPRRKIDPIIYRSIHKAIEDELGLDILYRSIKHPSPDKTRTIYPHSVIRSGFRWHIRAYEAQSGQFKDFNLSRIVKIVGYSDEHVQAGQIEHDKEWNQDVTLMLTPNKSFTDEQRKVIASDYTGSEDMAIIINVRASELLYVLHLYEVRDFSEKPPTTQLLQIGNPKTVNVYLPLNDSSKADA
jgi:hypothetical protein